eukprot:TRINITY_DN70790_c0_g1_i1.p1 TRINITY_DN70790_c0_g1~~TRINITY_DN70790_c0_g1_i1.p1  ORF type:complete len:1087 (+),score=353.42 TRINITY_DN70790_c0_g1_i1:67-3327(+)
MAAQWAWPQWYTPEWVVWSCGAAAVGAVAVVPAVRRRHAQRLLAQELEACNSRLAGLRRLRAEQFRCRLDSAQMPPIGDGRGTAPVFKDYVDLAGDGKKEVLCTVKGTHSRALYYLRKFEREAVMLHAVQGHPSVIKLVGIVMDHPTGYFLIYRYAPGKVLHELVTQGEYNVGLDAQMSIVQQIVDAMAFVHSKGVMHRDLKSLNIIVENHEDPEKLRARLIDFGSAIWIHDPHNDEPESSWTRFRHWLAGELQADPASLHTSGSGTLQWMAPEVQKRDGRYDERCDVYSFAMVLYEIASKHEPWGGGMLDSQDCTPGTVAMLVATEIRPLLPPNVPLAVASMITRCWATDPKQRPSFKDLKEELNRAMMRFAHVSQDGGRVVTLADLKRAWRWEKVSEAELLELFNEADTEGSGHLSVPQFLSLYAKARALGEPSHAHQRRRTTGAGAGVLAAGVVSVRGKKTYQEDYFALQRLADGGTFAGVFDGHGGHAAAEFVSERLPAILENPPLEVASMSPERAIIKCFLQADAELLEYFRKQGGPLGQHGGTTVAAAWTRHGALHLASVGDSLIVLCRSTATDALPRPARQVAVLPKRGEQLENRLREAGVDPAVLSGGLLAHLKGLRTPRYTLLTEATLAEWIRSGCPQYSDKTAAIFAALDADCVGGVEFEDFFGALVSGPLLQDERFAPVVWDAAEFGVGDRTIDADHQKLFDLVNGLVDAMRTGKQASIGAALEGLRAYSHYHFDREIEMLGKIPAYTKEQLEEHKRQHAEFVGHLEAVERGFADQDLTACLQLVTGDTIRFLKDWLRNHIKRTDMEAKELFMAAAAGHSSIKDRLQAEGVDSGVLSGHLSDYVRNRGDTRFKNVTPEAFSKMLEVACPQYASKADVIFRIVDTDNSGLLDGRELFAAILTGITERAWVPLPVHKPRLKGETARILHAGGHVCDHGRLQGRLAVSRALGDFDFKDLAKVEQRRGSADHLLSNRPAVAVLPLDDSVLFAIVASDGLWDVISPTAATERVLRMVAAFEARWGGLSASGLAWEELAQECCAELCKQALMEGTLDNTTVGVMFFDSLRIAGAAPGAAAA